MPKNANPISDSLNLVTSPADVRKMTLEQYKHLNLEQMNQCYVYGAGQDARDFIENCRSLGIKVLGVFDDDPKKLGTEFAGSTIQSTKGLKDPGADAPIIITTHRVALAARKLCDMGIKSYVPSWALQIVWPDRFPPHMYYRNWAEDLVENKPKYISLWDTFKDDESRKVYKAFIRFRLCFDPLVLLDCLDLVNEYFPEGVIRLSNNEVFVDGGAWTGDTIRVFKERVQNQFKRVYAFEPSSGTFEKLKANVAADPRVIPVNKGMHSETTVFKFQDFGSTASRINDAGTVEVPVTSIDEVVGDDEVSFIKMNIEGAEAAALRGAAKTIRKHKPKMALCVYHNPQDTWELPEIVDSIVGGYDYYLRLHDGGIIQLVVYAVPHA